MSASILGYMAEAAERVLVGVGKPSFLERHTPKAHTEEIMRRFFWATDHLHGKPKEVAEMLRPWAQRSANVAGWTQTFWELWLAGSAIAAVSLVGKKSLPKVSRIFGRMGERNSV